jgi:hypothetical protein
MSFADFRLDRKSRGVSHDVSAPVNQRVFATSLAQNPVSQFDKRFRGLQPEQAVQSLIEDWF